ncbi:MAG: ABC transporter permease [Candidatus Sungbacteria bacterium]|uniref:ABC transporter permease n=1 Tax=Candidatus Sungiibacteriota bacterium TaxID=2750080 RepID=A0A9D6LT82_9BACT|nr:ABC transporter permease [Candidatus Sungbacteria bacterium]
MKFQDVAKTSVEALKRNKTRSILTMLGIIIGIASVILLMSLGQSAQNLILNQVQGTGSNLIFVIPGGTDKGSRFSSPASVQGIVIKTLIQDDLDALKREPTIAKASAEVRGQAKIVYQNNDSTVTFDGTNADFFSIRNFTIARGAAFTDSDLNSFNRVAVLGSEISKTLFGELDPIGKTIRLKDVSFRVVGVLDAKGLGPFGIDQDNLVLVPITVAQRQMLGINYFNVITVEASDAYTIDFTKARIISVLRQDHRITDPHKDDFTIRTQEDALALLGNITSIMKLFLISIACISLIVGGIGIMNIMLVSVVERTREIGLRKAVGATNNDILQQFLFEAVMLTFAGGVIGIVIGSGLSVLAYVVLSKLVSTGWTLSLPISAVILAAGVSSLIGLVFGIYPARKAAIANPIDSLRYE